MNCIRIIEYAAIGLLFFIVVSLPQTGKAEVNPGMNHYIDGTEEYDAGLYDSALSSLGKAIELEPLNLDYQYYYAMTYSALGRFQEAESIYTVILNADAKNYYKAYFDLSAIYMKKKEYKKALKAISDAEWIVPGNTRIYLEKGTIYRKMKNNKAAVENFKRALELDKKLFQTVNYNIGLVYFGEKQYAAAKNMFNMVIAEKSDNRLADYARQAIEGISSTKKVEKPWKVNAYVSYSYDDNLSEDPLDLPGHMSSQADNTDGQYQVFFLMGEYKIIKLKDFQFSSGYQMTYINFNDSEHENSLGNSPYLLMQYKIKPFYLSLKYNFAHYFADSDNRQIQHKITPTMTIIEPHNMRSVISFVYQMKDYENDAPTEDVNVWTAELTQYFKLPNMKITPRIGFKYGDEDSEAVADTYAYIESSFGIEADLPFRLTGDLSFSDIRTNYKRSSGIKREDSGYLIEVFLKRDITKTLSTKLYYSYTHNKSNITYSSTTAPVYSYDPYKYDENHVRLSFSMNF